MKLHKPMFLLAIAVLSCREKGDSENLTTEQIYNGTNIYPQAPDVWTGGAKPYFSGGFIGDVMPYFENNKFNIYFLHDAKTKPAGEGFHAIHSFSSSDLSHFTYNGQQISYGTAADPDFGIGTGNVIKSNGKYYFYYSAVNENSSYLQNSPRASILLATSTDLTNWTKVTSFKLTAPAGYNAAEFRDPYVYLNSDTGKFEMLVGAQRAADGKAVVLRMSTTNLDTNQWTVDQPIYTTTAAENYIFEECPEIFKMGSYWYLIFSEDWSGSKGTHYRIGSSASGPWTKPQNDMIDGQYFYAGRTASDGTNRYIFGWDARRSPENNDGDKQWAGNLVIHLLGQNSDGTLKMTYPQSVSAIFQNKVAYKVQSLINAQQNNDNFMLAKEGKVVFGSLQKAQAISFDMSTTGLSSGIIFSQPSDNTDSGIKIAFEQSTGRIATYKRNNGSDQLVNYLPIKLNSGETHKIYISTGNDVCALYVDDKVAYTNRIYGINGSHWTLFNADGTANFNNLTVKNP